MNKQRILSGIRASGMLHLGNYLGAVKGMLALQDDPQYETFYMVADLHALTTPYDKDNLANATRNVIKDYLAAGLDPERSVLFVQSQVPQHTELSYLFSTVTTLAKLTHLPTYKETVKRFPENSTLALVTYPVLMTADILLYKAPLVPVGLDQEPHLEVAREIARRMNQDFGTDFPEPSRFVTKGENVPSLAGEGKMSKSVEGSFIALTDNLQDIQNKLAKAATDAGGPGNPATAAQPIRNLFKFIELFLPNRLEYYGSLYTQGNLRYKELKEELAKAIYEELRPMQERRAKLTDEYVDQVITDGAKKARIVASETVKDVKSKMGLL
jgi:tryptophanyl-tRNA synthetase